MVSAAGSTADVVVVESAEVAVVVKVVVTVDIDLTVHLSHMLAVDTHFFSLDC